MEKLLSQQNYSDKEELEELEYEYLEEDELLEAELEDDEMEEDEFFEEDLEEVELDNEEDEEDDISDDEEQGEDKDDSSIKYPANSIKRKKGLQLSESDEKELDQELEQFLLSKTKNFENASKGGASYLTIVKADSGTCIKLNKNTTQRLGKPEFLSVTYDDENLIICDAEGLNVPSYKGNYSKERTVIYNTGLVNDIIAKFNIDFSNKTSMTFSHGYFKKYGREVLYVKLV